MGEGTAIGWAHDTFNPWWGCTKVSAGCAHCYAERISSRLKKGQWGPEGQRRRTGPDNWGQPAKWNRATLKAGGPRRVFCASMADVFDDHASIEPQWRVDLWETIDATRALTWMLLTKRPENVFALAPPRWIYHEWPRHVWLGVSIEDQAATYRLDHVDRLRLDHRVDVPVVFASCEPLLGPLDLSEWLGAGVLDWLIVGAESGRGCRPMRLEWAASLRDEADAARTPFFFKQTVDERTGAKNELPLLDGRIWRQFPRGA